MSNCCQCTITSMVGVIANAIDPIKEIEEILRENGARLDVDIAFVLAWDTPSDIDSWMTEPNGTNIGYSSPYKGKVSGTQTYNYVLERRQIDVDLNSQYITSNSGNLDKDSISDNPAVENLVYFDKTKMIDGEYKYRIDDYSKQHPYGFRLYILVRNERLELEGYTFFQWEGEFSQNPKKQTSNAPIYISMFKEGDTFKFKQHNQTLKKIVSNNMVWVE